MAAKMPRRSFVRLRWSTVDWVSTRLSINWSRIQPATRTRRLYGFAKSQVVVLRVGELWPLSLRVLGSITRRPSRDDYSPPRRTSRVATTTTAYGASGSSSFSAMVNALPQVSSTPSTLTSEGRPRPRPPAAPARPTPPRCAAAPAPPAPHGPPAGHRAGPPPDPRTGPGMNMRRNRPHTGIGVLPTVLARQPSPFGRVGQADHAADHRRLARPRRPGHHVHPGPPIPNPAHHPVDLHRPPGEPRPLDLTVTCTTRQHCTANGTGRRGPRVRQHGNCARSPVRDPTSLNTQPSPHPP